ncbi:MAG: pyruvate kinase [Alphaproteobacteria bacterium]|nr:pyruvate kinase [Alphaproteobacteria bacterium]
MRRFRNGKIIATLGPKSGSEEQIRALFHAGADVFRLNMSHGTHAEQRAVHANIRKVEQEVGRPICVMLDLQGPKLRLGELPHEGVRLAVGQHYRLDLDPKKGDATRACLPHPEIFAALAPGQDLLINDGRVRLLIDRCDKSSADVTVTVGGKIATRKGVNVPGVALAISAMTNKDRADLAFGLELGVEWVALSFVQRPEDITDARVLVDGRARILAKLERPTALEHLTDIVQAADAIMVARGDLGVELPPESVPGWQKRIVRAARQAGKPVTIATQMLESMVSSPSPTRAEASDVATAVYDGADSVMLSAETATGDFPVEAVAMMHRIITQVEKDPLYRAIMDSDHHQPNRTAHDAITAAARQVAQTMNAVAIVTYTTSGSTTLRAARERPTVPILCVTPRLDTARALCLAWGVHAVSGFDATGFTDMTWRAVEIAKREGFAARGDRLVITAGVPFGVTGSTNLLHIANVGE